MKFNFYRVCARRISSKVIYKYALELSNALMIIERFTLLVCLCIPIELFVERTFKTFQNSMFYLFLGIFKKEKYHNQILYEKEKSYLIKIK